MDERLQFVARRRADGGTLQGVRHFSQDAELPLRGVALRRETLLNINRVPRWLSVAEAVLIRFIAFLFLLLVLGKIVATEIHGLFR